MADQATPNEGDSVISRATLEKMKKDELAKFAFAMYNLNLVPEQQDRREMIDQILSATRTFKGNTEMKVVKAGDTTTQVPPGYVKIKVSPGDYNPNKRPIIVGLNFKMASIPVNKEVIMPGRWMACLEDAVERRYFVGRDDHGDETLDWTDQHKYPFSLLVDNR
jgi:hypothetical protein